MRAPCRESCIVLGQLFEFAEKNPGRTEATDQARLKGRSQRRFGRDSGGAAGGQTPGSAPLGYSPKGLGEISRNKQTSVGL
jgi:hypothetical protein